MSYYNYKVALIKKISVSTYANSPSIQFHHLCRSLFFDRDHWRSNIGIISCPRSFAVQIRDHLRSWDHLRSNLGIICGPVRPPRVESKESFTSKYISKCVGSGKLRYQNPNLSQPLNIFRETKHYFSFIEIASC